MLQDVIVPINRKRLLVLILVIVSLLGLIYPRLIICSIPRHTRKQTQSLSCWGRILMRARKKLTI